MTPEIKIYELGLINFKSLKDFITDNSIEEDFMILLNLHDFENLLLEYLNIYGCSWEFPFPYLGINFSEDIYNKVKRRELGIIEIEDFDN
ncbi:hypothetical protein [Empedobacter sedimenti]|uniref:hypothetical protein n=1 Tax=Empedobacter sedimenti TaxID=3042610 RepID=UPI0024A65C19|nr:hypothetical protein [Empedobacter sedimenti]